MQIVFGLLDTFTKIADGAITTVFLVKILGE